MMRAALTAAPTACPLHCEARICAMTHLAMDEAIAACGRSAAPFREADRARRIAASAAAHAVLSALIPSAAARFDSFHQARLAAWPVTEETARAERIGREAAAVVLQRREGDGWDSIDITVPPDGTMSAANRVAAGATPARSPWLSAKPFLLKNVDQFTAAVPRRVTMDGSVQQDTTLSDARFFKEVNRRGPPEALTTAWEEDGIIAWNRVARAVVEEHPLDLAREARLFAVLNLALADAALLAQHARFTLGSWHVAMVDIWEDVNGAPERSTDVPAIVDGGISATMLRAETHRVLIAPMRDYPSVAATLAGAAQAALAGCFRTDKVGFSVAGATGSAATPREFASFSQAAKECSFVANLDGRHTREACIAGHQLGTAIGGYIAKRTAARR